MKKSFIAVASPAGGVGKSTLSKELATIYAAAKVDGIPLRVCLVDANIAFGSQRILFGIGETKYDITDLIRDYGKDVEELGYLEAERKYDWETVQKYLTFVRDRNLYLLPAPKMSSDMTVSRSEADVVFRVLLKLFDVVLVDTANDASEFTNAAILLSSYTAFVMIDDERSVNKLIQMRRVINSLGFGDRLKENCGIVYNMYRKRKERYLEIADVEDRVRLPVIGTIPYFRDSWTYNNRRVALANHDTPASSAILKLASFLVPGVLPENDDKTSVISYIKKLF